DTISLPDWGRNITAAPTAGDDLTGWKDSGGTIHPAETPYTVTGAVTLTAQWGPFTSTQAVGDYLGSTGTAGTTITAPIPLTVNIPSSEWGNLLTTLQSKNKYVDLDLSASTMMGTEFDPGTANTGEKYIVSLTLPDAAQSIKAGTSLYSAPTFKNFTALKEISGANVTTIGNYAFSLCKALSTVDLPVATSIGDYAFAQCTALSTVSLPVVTSIDDGTFSGCTMLTSVSLPAATSIGNYAFYACSVLSTVSFPKATSIGGGAFYRCSALSTVSLPVATSIGYSAFQNCSTLSSVSLPKASTIDEYAFDGCSALSTVNLPVASSIGYYAFDRCSTLSTVSLPANCTISSDAEIRGNFKTYYDDQGKRQGTYTFNGTTWTGP
ncbi:MAG: leucine-rich repeat domain-containing protein, partial [Treponema sp.]|nr:leucine-rich repeat domain-containing protein [Treponema sp.]